VLALRNNSFQIFVANFFKQQLTLSLDVLSANDSFRLVPLDQFPQALPPLDKLLLVLKFQLNPGHPRQQD
jgi:hypothetical protein